MKTLLEGWSVAGRPVPVGSTGKAVGKNVREARQRYRHEDGHLGMTQPELAAAMTAVGRSMSDQAVRALENGRRRIDADDLTALAAVLDVTPNELLRPLDGEDPLLTGLPEGLAVEDVEAWLNGQLGELGSKSLGMYWARQIGLMSREGTEFVQWYEDANDPGEREAYLRDIQRQVERIEKAKNLAVSHFRAAGMIEEGDGWDRVPSLYRGASAGLDRFLAALAALNDASER